MLPWLIPIYFAALICGFIAMQVYKTTKWKVAIWIVIASVSLSLIAAVALHPPHVEGGPGGLSGFNGIPNLAVFVICGGVLIALFVTRPPTEAIYSKFGLIVVLLCLLVEVTVANIPELWGFYPLKIHVVDWQGRSLAGIRMDLSEERTGLSLEQAF